MSKSQSAGRADPTPDLDRLESELAARSRTFAGFPDNLDYDYSPLLRFMRYSIFNVGDPYVGSSYSLNVLPFERDVIEIFAGLYRLDASERWGYITSGGTEGNIVGLLLGRERYPSATLYFSQDAHYSIRKAARLLRIPHVVVPSRAGGEIDPGCLEEALKRARGAPAIVSANIGTTMRGAIDDLDAIAGALRRAGATEFHIHCDAALFGLILPFLDGAPALDFTTPIGSLAVSGHKMLGCPLPCGAVVARRSLLGTDRLARGVEYVHSLDSTLLGSRSGQAVLMMWYALRTKGPGGLAAAARACVEDAAYLRDRLAGAGIPAERHLWSNIVYLKRPAAPICEKWSLSAEGDLAHVVVMPHVTRALLDELLADLIDTAR
jgi:histidine decarboxylase